MDISILPNVLFHIGPFAITSAHLTALSVSIVLALTSIVVAKRSKIIPSRIQLVWEMILDWFDTQVNQVCPPRYRRMVFALVSTLFFFIVTVNYFSFYPLITALTFDGKLMFTTATAHLSLTLGLALLVVLLGHIIAFFHHPIGHLGNYIRIKAFFKIKSGKDVMDAVIGLFLGFMDIVGEFAKIFSLSCRLFGNLLAGDLMATVIINLAVFTKFLFPVPFYVLGLLSNLVQAVVFSLLSLQFISATLASIPEKKTTDKVVAPI